MESDRYRPTTLVTAALQHHHHPNKPLSATNYVASAVGGQIGRKGARHGLHVPMYLSPWSPFIQDIISARRRHAATVSVVAALSTNRRSKIFMRHNINAAISDRRTCHGCRSSQLMDGRRATVPRSSKRCNSCWPMEIRHVITHT